MPVLIKQWDYSGTASNSLFLQQMSSAEWLLVRRLNQPQSSLDQNAVILDGLRRRQQSPWTLGTVGCPKCCRAGRIQRCSAYSNVKICHCILWRWVGGEIFFWDNIAAVLQTSSVLLFLLLYLKFGMHTFFLVQCPHLLEMYNTDISDNIINFQPFDILTQCLLLLLVPTIWKLVLQ